MRLKISGAVAAAFAALAVAGGGLAGVAQATPATVVVKPSAMNGWYFWNDKNDLFTGSPGAFVAGPATVPLGAGSVRLGPLTDSGTTAAGHSAIATDAYFDTALANITSLGYSSFQPGPTVAVALQFDVRYRTTDVAYGGRLVFEPYQNGTVSVGSGWQSWSLLGGKWWATKTTAAGTGGAQAVALPSGNCAMSTPCTWSQITAAFPAARIFGRTLLKAGSGPGWIGFNGNADALTIGVGGTDTTYDFEAETPCTTVCFVNGATGNNAAGGDTPATAKKTIQAAVTQVSAGGTVNVAAGTYNEDVTLTKTLALLGAGMGTTTISGPSGGPGATVAVTKPNTLIDGFTITRDGNAVETWNGPLNSIGVSISGSGTAEVRNSTMTGNRTGIDINNSSGNYVHDNVIADNRTGMIFRNVTGNETVVRNLITNNWTLGIVFLDASVGTNVPLQTASSSTFSRNDISGNWYGGVVDRQTGGSLPAPGANSKNFTCNWWGSTAPTVSTADSTEPGYALQIPVAFGGTAVAPGGQPDIAGPASANVDYSSWLLSANLDGTCNGGTARGYKKTAALANLAGIVPSGSKNTDKRVNDAIEEITASLDSPNWTDDNRISGKKADKVFENEKSAVKSLTDIKGTVPAGATLAIDNLLAADRLLAQTAIDDGAGGNAEKLAEAAKEMAKAQNEIAKGHFEQAIGHFKNAWKQAQEALAS